MGEAKNGPDRRTKATHTFRGYLSYIFVVRYILERRYRYSLLSFFLFFEISLSREFCAR